MFLLGGAIASAAETDEPLVQIGECELGRDPYAGDGPGDMGLSLCLKGAAGLEATFAPGTPAENTWIRHADGYAGLHIGPWVSLHARGVHRHQMPLEQDALPENRDTYTDYALVRVFNPAIHKWSLAAGRMRLPFGIDRGESTEFHQTFENRVFWESPPHGTSLIYDSHRAWLVEAGYGTDRYAEGSQLDEDAGTDAIDRVVGQENRAGSLRVSYDIAALDGSRLMFSGYGEKRGTRRWGFGFVTVSRKGDVTHFEWIRRRSTPDGTEEDYKQLIRVGYLSTYRSNARWAIQFDDERRQSRIGTLAHDFRIFDHSRMRLGITYYKSENGDDYRRWFLTSGVEVYL